MSTAWLFPGQGSQSRTMGEGLFDRFPQQVAEAEAILGYSVRAACQEPPGTDRPNLARTQYVQPLLYLVNALTALARQQDGAAPPDHLAGHSLGEYNALLVACCFDLGTGLRLVAERGRLMGLADGGGMLAVVRAPVEQVLGRLERAGLTELDVANRNSADQLVLSGTTAELAQARALLTEAGIGRCVPLKVSAAFHSRHMKDAAVEFRSVLDAADLRDPTIPVIANVTGQPYRPGTVAELLSEQIFRPVRWWESMSLLVEAGVEHVEEVGPGTVLGKLWTDIRAKPVPATTAPAARRLRPGALGSARFRRDYRLRYAYLAGAMYRGIASADLVIRMASAGLMGFLGTGGLTLSEVDESIERIRAALGPRAGFGVNLLATPDAPEVEDALVRLLIERDIRYIEAAGFATISPALVCARFTGAHREADGTPVAVRHVLAKVSRPEVAAAFMAPPPAKTLAALVAAGRLTPGEAEAAALLPVSADICVEADSGGHTDAGNPYVLLPAMLNLRERVMAESGYAKRIRVGAAGGLGAPEALAAAFLMGADFVVTGSVNQCTPQAGTSELVKELLAELDVQDTAYAPAGDMFEIGARVQVVRRGTLFPARANKLYQLWRQHESIDEIDANTRRNLEERFFRVDLDTVWAQTREYLAAAGGDRLARCDANPKARMAQIFKSYFARTTASAINGDGDDKVNFQIHCGPAMGNFNRLVAGTDLADWRNRHVDVVAELLMSRTAELLDGACGRWLGQS